MADIDDYLQSVEEQKFEEESKILVVNNPTVDLIIERYENWLDLREKRSLSHAPEEFKICSKLFRDINCSPKSISAFCFLLKKYEKHREFDGTGFFLSALIDRSRGNHFELFTKHLSQNIDNLGCMNKKNVRIFGNVGECAGRYMLGGKLIIEGNTGDYLGWDAKKGKIYVSGEIKSIDGYCEAKVYQKGKLIWPE